MLLAYTSYLTGKTANVADRNLLSHFINNSFYSDKNVETYTNIKYIQDILRQLSMKPTR